MIEVSKKAVLFDKAIADFYIAESIYEYRPDFALYHLNQSVEKLIKGALRCYGNDTEYDHDIGKGMEELLKKVRLSVQLISNCKEIERYSSSLRYLNKTSDPTAEIAKVAIGKVRIIMTEIAHIPEVERYYNEALEVNLKMLNRLEERKIDLERKPLEELLQDVRKNSPKNKEENQREGKTRRQEFIK